MSVKETIRQWVESIPDDSPVLLDLYEQARLDIALVDAMEKVLAGSTTPLEQVVQEYAERRQQLPPQ